MLELGTAQTPLCFLTARPNAYLLAALATESGQLHFDEHSEVSSREAVPEDPMWRLCAPETG